VDYLLFLLVTGILFVRPTDVVPALESLPLYQVAIVSCIIVSWNKIVGQFSKAKFASRPVTAFMVGLLLVSVFSNVAHGNFAEVATFTPAYAKLLMYLILLVGVIDSPGRLHSLLGSLVIIILVPTILTVAHYHGAINIPAYEAMAGSDSTRLDSYSGEALSIQRLKGSGTFADPNDVCEILNLAIVFALYAVSSPGSFLPRVFCLAALPVFGYALTLTHSRGGFVGFLISLAVLLWAKVGLRKSAMLGVILLPIVFTVFGGRQTSIGAGEETGQSRIQLWADGFELLKGSPVWGIGTHEFVKYAGHVAHNSFIHSATELGLVGGTLYFGMFFYALTTLKQLGAPEIRIPDPTMRRIRPYILAALAGFTASELSLTNCYVLSTYVILGLATAWICLANPRPPLPVPEINGRLIGRTIKWSATVFLCLYVFTQLNVRWG
jgi:O-antigen ligase